MYILITAYILAAFSLSSWAKRNNWGKQSFTQSPQRLNNCPAWMPILLFGIWITAMLVFAKFISIITGIDNSDNLIITQSSLGAASAITIFISIFAASILFDDGIVGFGIGVKKIKTDFFRAAKVLAKTYPAIVALMLTVGYLAPIISGGKTEVPSHPLLDYANNSGSVYVILFVAFIAVVLAPVIEEILFRGYLQTKLSDNLQNRLYAILFTSLIFAVIHGGELWLHWPALFLFSCALGYTYEKSGSLLQPIFMHAIFNAVNLSLSVIYARYFDGL